MSTSTKAAKPPVNDSKGNTLELRMKVIFDEDKGSKSTGHIIGLEHQRQRVVIRTGEGPKDYAVRPASKVRVEKNRSGKVLRVEKAVRAARKTATPAAA